MTATSHKKKKKRRRTKRNKNKFCKANDWLNKWGRKWKKLLINPPHIRKLRYPRWIQYAYEKKQLDEKYPRDTRLLTTLFQHQQAHLFYTKASTIIKQAGQPHDILMYYFVSFNLYEWKSVFRLLRCSPDFKHTRFAKSKHSFIIQYQNTFESFLKFVMQHHEWSSFWLLFETMMTQFVHVPIKLCARCKDVYKKPQCDFHVYM